MATKANDILRKIHCGDSAEVMATWPGGFVHLTITSPPYHNLRDYDAGNTFNLAATVEQLYRLTVDGGIVVWIVADIRRNHRLQLIPFRHATALESAGFSALDMMIYQKAGCVRGHNWRHYPNGYEFMIVVFRGRRPRVFNPIRDRRNTTAGDKISGGKRKPDGEIKPAHNTGEEIGRLGYRSNVWRYPTGFNLSTADVFAFEHPAIFPEALARDHILSWSNVGDVVLDPFVGSGTTPKMAIELGRRWVGIDVSPVYCELARRRVELAKIPLPGCEVVECCQQLS